MRALRRPSPAALCALGLAGLLLLPATPSVAGPPQAPGVQLIEAWPDRTFDQPIFVVHAGDGTDFLFVGEQSGRVQRIAKYRGTPPVPAPSVYLDLSALCYPKSQGGLLGMAFHPDFRSNRLLYVSYLAENRGATDGRPFTLRIAEYRDAGGRADPTSARIVFEVPKKTAQHQGGWIAFGPDRLLYIGTGDGNEGKDDAAGNAQSPSSLLGKMLRIDPQPSGGRSWTVPKDNPWPAAQGVHPAVWAYGLRNPWRFCWDAGGRLWTTQPGTSGPESREWISRVERGLNHGWPFREGTRTLKAPPAGQSFVPTAFEWVRGEAGGTAGIGGHFYRGDRVKGLQGRYIFADYMLGEVYAISLPEGAGGQGTGWQKVGDCPDCASIGEDAQGELYFCSNGDLGVIFTMAPTGQ
jgi:glucose/arabinose dehydrogenase